MNDFDQKEESSSSTSALTNESSGLSRVACFRIPEADLKLAVHVGWVGKLIPEHQSFAQDGSSENPRQGPGLARRGAWR